MNGLNGLTEALDKALNISPLLEAAMALTPQERQDLVDETLRTSNGALTLTYVTLPDMAATFGLMADGLRQRLDDIKAEPDGYMLTGLAAVPVPLFRSDRVFHFRVNCVTLWNRLHA